MRGGAILLRILELLVLKAQSRQEAAAWVKSGVVRQHDLFVNLQLVQDSQKIKSLRWRIGGEMGRRKEAKGKKC